jgi:CDP-glucose 4,6-dehydratase
LGARITGYSLLPPTEPSLFEICNLGQIVHSIEGEIRSRDKLRNAVLDQKPDIVIHMAAQPILRASYSNPVETFEINVMGTVHLLDAVKHATDHGVAIKAVINITTDKCYENREWHWAYRENDVLGGYDPYSNSKACSELVTSSYRNSFFNPKEFNSHEVAIASARAGNVIGGGDWARDRIIPDCIRAFLDNRKVKIRNPYAIRPWQHVLEPISGYLLLAQKMVENGPKFAEAWNFGPNDADAMSVQHIVQKLCDAWAEDASYDIENTGKHWHEAQYLKLDCSKAKAELGWQTKWNVEQSICRIVEWTKSYRDHRDMREVCLQQIQEYSRAEGADS